MHKGVTLLETIVVIGIIGTLSLMGINNINSFRREAGLDNAANELVSMIKLARSMSMNGELIVDKTTNQIEELSTFNENGLPYYGVEITADSYKLKRKCEKTDRTDCSGDDLGNNVYFADDYKITEGEIYFQRITGESDPSVMTILIEEKEGGIEKRKITISDDFVVTVIKE